MGAVHESRGGDKCLDEPLTTVLQDRIGRVVARKHMLSAAVLFCA